MVLITFRGAHHASPALFLSQWLLFDLDYRKILWKPSKGRTRGYQETYALVSQGGNRPSGW